MSTKTEERLKNLLEDFYDKKEQRIENILLDKSMGVFFWGFILGALFSYMSLLPFSIGLIFGISIVKKNPLMINTIVDRAINIINSGKNTLHDKIGIF